MKCQAITGSGEQCSREAEEDSKYCWQHSPQCDDPGGRRPKFETAEELQGAIEEYFKSCFITATNSEGEEYQKRIRPWTVTGLAYHLGMTREGLLHYEGKGGEFADTITHAKTRIEMYNEEQLHRGQGKTNGIQFNLKNNFNWKDKQEHDIQHSGGVEIVDDIGK